MPLLPLKLFMGELRLEKPKNASFVVVLLSVEADLLNLLILKGVGGGGGECNIMVVQMMKRSLDSVCVCMYENE